MSCRWKWITATVLFAVAGPVLVWIGIVWMMITGSATHPATVLLYPAAPFVSAGKALGLEGNETMLTLAAALGYGSLPLLAWGAWSAFRSWRRERA